MTRGETIFHCTMDIQMEILCYCDEERNVLFVYDDCSSITCLNNKFLFVPGSLKKVSPVKVRNSSDVYSRIQMSGEAFEFGRCFYDKDQFISILCAHDIERNKNFEVVEIKNSEQQRIGYNLFVKRYNITLFVRWVNRIMIGSFRPLLDFIEKLGEPREQHEDIFFAATTISPAGAKASSNLKTMAKTERAVNRVRKIQYRLGFMSDEHASVAAKSGFFINLPVSSADFKLATSISGPDIPMLKGKGTIDRHMDYVDLTPQLKDGELLVEIDLAFIGHHVFLIGITMPFNYGIAIYIGIKKGSRKKDNLLRAILHMKKIIAEYNYSIKFLVFDSERSLSDDGPINIVSIQDQLFEQEDIFCQQLPTGVHAKRVERKIQHWKSKIRSCNFRLLYAIPQSLVPSLGIAAMVWCNLDPTDANINMCPPIFLMSGEPIDAKKLCVSTFGELVLSPVDNGIDHNSTVKGRRTEAIYLYPIHTKGMHRLLLLDSLDGQIQFVSREVKPSEVFPHVPLSIVARMNNRARHEIVSKKLDALESSAFDELRELTGYRDDLQFDTPIDLLSRDSRTISIEPHDDGSAMLPEHVESTIDLDGDDAYYLTQQSNSCFWLQHDTSEPQFYSFAVKKEIPFSKAHSAFDSDKVKECMKKELSGLVNIWHPVKISNLTKAERKNILPGQGLVKNKSKDKSIELLKGRFVAGGHRQDVRDYDIYREISTPTASLSSLFAVAAHAAAKGLAVASFDIKMAYTKAPMPKDKKIYIRLIKSYVDLIKVINPDLKIEYESFQNEDGSVIVELDFALYGCVEAGRLFYEFLKNILVKKMDYKVSLYDDCIFNLFDDNGIIISTIVIHVDDGLITGSSETVLDSFFDQFKNHIGDITIQRGRIHNYLGMVMDFSQPNVVHITIEKMIRDILSDWSINKGSRSSPAKSQLFDIDEQSPQLNEEMSRRLHRGIAQLLYLSTHVRPDILCAVIFLTSRIQKLSEEDLEKFLDILYYLNGSISLGIMLGGDAKNRIRLYAFADASYGVHTNCRSHGGTYITYGRGPTLVRSNVLKDISISSSESELMQLSTTTSLAARERYFAIEQQHINPTEKGILLEDNKSAIHMANNGKSISNRTRHIKIKYFFVKQFLDNGEFHLEHCPTKEMVADILTKPLQGEHFLELRDLLLGYEALSR